MFLSRAFPITSKRLLCELGDIDIAISHSDGVSHRGLLPRHVLNPLSLSLTASVIICCCYCCPFLSQACTATARARPADARPCAREDLQWQWRNVYGRCLVRPGATPPHRLEGSFAAAERFHCIVVSCLALFSLGATGFRLLVAFSDSLCVCLWCVRQLVAWGGLGCCLLYLTGSDMFNRFIRQYSRYQVRSLLLLCLFVCALCSSHRCAVTLCVCRCVRGSRCTIAAWHAASHPKASVTLYVAVLSLGRLSCAAHPNTPAQDIQSSVTLEFPTEESVFAALGIPYIPPHERSW